LTGSNDDKIIILNEKTLTKIQTIDCKKVMQDSIKPSIRSLDVWGNKILVGTLGS